jgi:hypothetical protein
LLPCLRTYVLPCFRTSILLWCFHASVLSCFHGASVLLIIASYGGGGKLQQLGLWCTYHTFQDMHTIMSSLLKAH